MSQQVASLFAKISADTTDFDRGMSSSHKALTSFSGLIGGGLVIAAAAGAAAIAGVGAIMVKGIKSAAELEQNVANIGATMGLAGADMKPFKDMITNLALDPKLKVNLDEASSAVAMLAKMGVRGEQDMSAMARATVLLSNSTGGDLATSAEVAMKAQKLWNLSIEDTGFVTNQTVGFLQNSTADLNDYRLGMSAAGGVASSLGVTLEDFNASLGVSIIKYGSAASAGDGLKTFLTALNPLTDTAKDKMEELGLITAEGANQFFTAAGAMKSQAEIADLLANSIGGLSAEQQGQALQEIFGRDAMRTAIALMEERGAGIDAFKAKLANTDAEAAAATRQATLTAQWALFTDTVAASVAVIGDQFNPAGLQVIEWLSSMSAKYMPSVISWFAKFAAWLTDALPKIEAFIEGLALWAGTLGLQWQRVADGTVSAGETIAWWAGFIWDKVVEAFGKAVEWIKAQLPVWVAKLQEWGAAAGNWITDVGWPALVANLRKWGANLWAWIVEQYPIWISNLKAWGVAAGAWIMDTGWPMLLANLRKWATQLGSWLREQLPIFIAHLVEWAVQLGAWVIQGIAYLIDNLANGVQQVSKWLRGTGQTRIKDGVFSWVAPMWEWVMTELWPKLEPALWALSKAVLKIIGSMGGLLFEAIMAIARGIVNVFIKALDSVWGGLVDWWNGLWFGLGELVGEIWMSIKDIPGYIIDGFKRAFTERWEGFKQWWRDAWENMTEIVQMVFGVHSPSTVFFDIGMSLMQGLQEGIHIGIPLVENALADMTHKVAAATAGMYDQMNAATKEIALRASYAGIAAGEQANVTNQIAKEWADLLAKKPATPAYDYVAALQANIDRQQAVQDAAYAANQAAKVAAQMAAVNQQAEDLAQFEAKKVAANVGSLSEYMGHMNDASLSGYTASQRNNAIMLLDKLNTASGAQEFSKTSNITIENINLGVSGNAAQDIIAAIGFLNASYSYGY